ncbi:MAG TPA: corrinoid protein [Clostridia bacterium]|jgi:5-methyltetrahydrofolate--homocysteine methyltransferase|nr:cobalamin-binding protein [Clostridiaceae bacterium]HOA30590.1 corrinoid protein [Clostridia bacterium]HPZ52647.1 corrinoid protein [Clostridia bacterium]
MKILEDISLATQKGKAKDVKQLVTEALEIGVSAQEILDKGLLDGMGKLGVRFKNNEVYVPEVLIAARALNNGTEILSSKLIEEGVKPIGKVVIATVKGDLHDIGKNLVKMMLEGAGFEVIDLGTDVSDEEIVKVVQQEKPQILALSALLTTTMTNQKVVIETLKEANLRDKVKVMVGGAPVTQTFADEIGADGYAEDAATAAEVARMLI